jgi:hypothetical protein
VAHWILLSFFTEQNVNYDVGFEVLTAVSMKMAVFWVVMLCSLVEVYQRFRRTCCLHHQGDESETTRHYNPEDSHLHELSCLQQCKEHAAKSLIVLMSLLLKELHLPSSRNDL